MTTNGRALPCRVCGSTEARERFEIREMMFGSAEEYPYGLCPTCGSLVIEAIPGDLARHYPRDYYAFRPVGAVEDIGRGKRWATGVLVDRRVFRKRHRRSVARLANALVVPDLTPVQQLAKAARLGSRDDAILDVGSGSHPDRLVVLRNLGFRRLLAIDPYVDKSGSHVGVPVRKASIEDVTGRFRLITFHHSLEHVPDPQGTLRCARSLIESDGRLQIRTPVMGTGLWRRYGTDWVEIDAPRHLAVFSVEGMRRLAAAAGFAIERIGWESAEWEFIASEQYRLDIPLHGPGSQIDDPAVGRFDDATIDAFRVEARRLNAESDGGRASFWLRPIHVEPEADSAPPSPVGAAAG
jgi:hypothetical protein